MIALKYPMLCGGLLAAVLMLGWDTPKAEAQYYYPAYTFGWAPAPVVVAPPPVYYAPPPVYYAPPPVYYAPPPVYYAPAPVYHAPAYIYHPRRSFGFSYHQGRGYAPYHSRGRSFGFGFHYSR